MWVPKKKTRDKRVEIFFAPQIVVNDLMMILSFSEIWRRCPPSLSSVPLLFLFFLSVLFLLWSLANKHRAMSVPVPLLHAWSLWSKTATQKKKKETIKPVSRLLLLCWWNHEFRTKISWSAAAPKMRLSFLALLLANCLSCNEEVSSISNQSPGWQGHERTGPQQSY